MATRTLLLSILLLLCEALIAQAPPIQWKTALGGSFLDFGAHIEQTSDGGYIMAGESHGTGGDVTGYHGTTETGDFWVVKLDATGAIQWSKSLGGISVELGFMIHQAPDGSFLVGGAAGSGLGDGDMTVASHGGGTDWWLVRLSPTGSILWQQRYGGEQNDYLYDFQFTPDGGYILTGNTASTIGDVSGNHGNYDAWVVKLNSAGSIEWQRCIGGSQNDQSYSVVVLPTGYVIAGSTESNDGNITNFHGVTDMLAAKLDLNGNIVWVKNLGSSGKDEGTSIVRGSDGGVVIAGYAEANNGDVTGVHTTLGNLADFWVIRMDDATGSILWQRCYGGSKNEQCNAICATPDGGYALAGHAWSDDGDITCRGTKAFIAGWVIKISSTGALQWQKIISGGNWDEERSVQPTSDGGLIVGGGTALSNFPNYHKDLSPNGSVGDFAVIKMGLPTGPPPPLPTISLNPPPANVCSGSDLTLTATVANIPANAVYTWYRNGSDMQLNTINFTASNFADGDKIYCQLTADVGCGSQNFKTSTVILSISPLKAPQISISSPTAAACAGSPVDFLASVQGGSSGPAYRWLVNGSLKSSLGPTFTTSLLTNGDLITCEYSDNTACYTQKPNASNQLTAQIIPLVIPSITITTTTPAICEDAEVKFSAAATNGGTSPTFQWKLNNVPTGSNTPAYGSKTLKDADVVTCVLTSNAVCSSPATATSNPVPIKVNPKVPTQTRIDYPAPICSGANVVFTARTTGMVNPSYYWVLNGNNVSTTPTFSSSTLVDGDVLLCRSTETGPSCAQASLTSINPIKVNPTPEVGTALPLVIGQGQTATLRLPVTGGNIEKYQWSPGESLADATAANPLATPVKSTVYTLEATTDAGCSAKGTLTVKVISSIILPSAFSPNGDGRNEVFYVIGGPLNSKIKDFVIFDRWGRNVFQVHGVPTDDPAYGWAGRIGGSPAPGGTYVYEIRIGFADGTEQALKGTILLVR